MSAFQIVAEVKCTKVLQGFFCSCKRNLGGLTIKSNRDNLECVRINSNRQIKFALDFYTVGCIALHTHFIVSK